jgi:hypothetical protein
MSTRPSGQTHRLFSSPPDANRATTDAVADLAVVQSNAMACASSEEWTWARQRSHVVDIPMFPRVLDLPNRVSVSSVCRRGGIRHRGSADDLVGLEEEGRGDGEAEGLGGLEVED